MKLAFCLFKFFPYGGLQRDFLRIACVCQKRGHEIHVYTMHWEGEPEEGFHIHLPKVTASQNHTRCQIFSDKLQEQLKTNSFDVVIGFNKLPHLDIYYTADVCYQDRIHNNRFFFHRWLPRYRQLASLEKSVFARGNSTQILLLAAQQQAPYVQHYQTEAERFHLLPPGISQDRIAPKNAMEIRKKIRSDYQLTENHKLILMIGSGFKAKGLDRAILALANLPEDIKNCCQLFVIGQDDASRFQRLAKKLNLEKRVLFLGGQDDIPSFLLAADLLIHPAYHENTGTVILEAIVSGLPVLTTDVCGYAHYVEAAKGGMVITSPFSQAALNTALTTMLTTTEKSEWQKNALTYTQS